MVISWGFTTVSAMFSQNNFQFEHMYVEFFFLCEMALHLGVTSTSNCLVLIFTTLLREVFIIRAIQGFLV